MKVLTLTSLYPNNQQSLKGIFNRERVRFLSRLCEVKVVAPVPYFPPIRVNEKWYMFSQVTKKEVIDGIEVFHPRRLVTPKIGMLFYGIFYFLSVVGTVFLIKRRFDFDLIDSHFAYPDAFAAVLLGKLFRKSVIVTVHGTDINLFPRYRLIRSQIIFVLKNANRVIAVSNALKQKIVALGLPASKIEVIPNGVDIDKFRFIDKVQARKTLNLPIDKKIILSVGSLTELKGFHYLIDAIHQIKKSNRNSDTLLIGVGEGVYRKRLECKVKELDLQKEVKLVGQIPYDELHKWYCASDLFALASSREGWPTVFFEAFACGKPVVATRIDGVPEVICSENYGILVDRRDNEELTEKISLALHSDWDRDKIIDYAKQNTWDKVTKKLFNEFKMAVNYGGEK